MRQHLLGVTIAAVLVVSPALTVDASASDPSVQLGPRPYYLVDKMSPSPLKSAARAVRRRSVLQEPTSRSATAAAARCSSPSTPRRATRRARAWARASSSAT